MTSMAVACGSGGAERRDVAVGQRAVHSTKPLLSGNSEHVSRFSPASPAPIVGGGGVQWGIPSIRDRRLFVWGILPDIDGANDACPSILIARKPGILASALEGPDNLWSQYVSLDDAGEFFASLPLWALERPVGGDAFFSFTIDSTVGAIGQAWLPIPGQQMLSPSVRLVNACHGLEGSGFDPEPLIYAVQRLREMGRHGSVNVLQRFCSLAPMEAPPAHLRDPALGDTADRQSLFSILALLFEAKRGPPSLGIPMPRGVESIESEVFPLYVVNGVPFLCVDAYICPSGIQEDPCSDLEAWRTATLRPPNTNPGCPLEAAEVLLRSCAGKSFYTAAWKTMIRKQALRAMPHSEWSMVGELLDLRRIEDDDWAKTSPIRRSVEWSRKLGRYERQ